MRIILFLKNEIYIYDGKLIHYTIERETLKIRRCVFCSAGGVHVSASRGSPPGGTSVGGGQAGGMGSGLNCGQGSPGTTSGSGTGGGGSSGGGSGGGGVTCVGADVSANETSDWRGAHSIAALRRRASDASQQYSPQPPPPPGPPQYTHDMEYSPVYWGLVWGKRGRERASSVSSHAEEILPAAGTGASWNEYSSPFSVGESSPWRNLRSSGLALPWRISPERIGGDDATIHSTGRREFESSR